MGDGRQGRGAAHGCGATAAGGEWDVGVGGRVKGQGPRVVGGGGARAPAHGTRQAQGAGCGSNRQGRGATAPARPLPRPSCPPAPPPRTCCSTYPATRLHVACSLGWPAKDRGGRSARQAWGSQARRGRPQPPPPPHTHTQHTVDQDVAPDQAHRLATQDDVLRGMHVRERRGTGLAAPSTPPARTISVVLPAPLPPISAVSSPGSAKQLMP